MSRKVAMIVFAILSLHLSFIFFRAHAVLESDQVQDNRKKIIIDTDAGGDDAVALMLALATKEVQILAITCTYGNTIIENVEINVLKTLTIANRSDIPVFSGAQKPLLNNYTATGYFGEDGFGDFHFDKKLSSHIDKSNHAVNAMISLVGKYPGEVNILVLGPLTNVALAASLDSNFTKLVKKFYVMGSSIKESSENPGYTEIEFNFNNDPEGNAIFLNSTTQSLSLVLPWDIAAKSNISKKWRTEILGKLESESIKFLNKVESVTLNKLNEWQPSDSIAVAAMIWPDLVISSLKTRMTAVIRGPLRGSVMLKHPTNNISNNVEIVTNFNNEAFQAKLIAHLAQL
ncbi:hypothetical protein QAD02_019725 [Eretmocerus hayati]|uniref:Uncharacterized protein n=1 Tax=Eretmocerus hayati TaxID=131215 RepID=A0ACC2PKD8_9HYME|nr:hypothetical protein QAD02_019725 [Eretmocerus hayati]